MNTTENICNLCNKAHGSFSNAFFETFAIICFFVFLIVILTIISSFITNRHKFSIKNIFDKLKEKCFKKNVLKVLNKDHNFLEIYDERTNDFVYYLNDKFFNKINGKFIEIPFNRDIFNYDWYIRSIFKYDGDEDNQSNLEKYPKYIISINYLRNFKNRKDYRTDWKLTEKLHDFCKKNEKTKYYVENL